MNQINGNQNRTSVDSEVTSKPKNILKCMYFNARSILNKLDELELYIKDENLDIVGVTETWLTEEILTSEVSIDGYTVH